ncbi:hypothetical protein [Clostridium algidicarnis]|uniref:hypothetical protein n=1 Tax=Clostridium algidicarnis TaxID=37659 RepID=UPI001C0D1763|nr:hypothetical protein [Clostridium algidicarnis]MBU3203932.1 hypothetical protein [Clostridium algidicarnis]MBU3212086.1 hypothetical protein [Clostridium algidicarnis]MBU3221408.1 hypothetical protein [Clostridium algidicarnis]
MLRAFGAQYGELKYLKLACKKLIDIYNEPEISYVYNDINLKDSDNIIVLNEGEIEEMGIIINSWKIRKDIMICILK